MNKKKRFFIFALSCLFILMYCGCEKNDDDDNVSGPTNSAPTTPFNPIPANGTEEVLFDITLSWSCDDPDGDSLTYNLYFGTEETPPLFASNLDTPAHIVADLESETTYFWKIEVDDGTTTAYSDLWTFTTCFRSIENTFPLGDTGLSIEMVWIPAGTFLMGAQEEENGMDYEYPRHQVTISQGFWMGKFEVTQEQWEAVVGTSPFFFDHYPDRPAEMVSYDDIMEDFLPEINATETENPWRLPTEAEWEYACRAGEDDEWFWWGNSYDDIGDNAWYYANSSYQTHDVGQKTPNPWGLYDMSGNVWEWCSDWFDYYNDGPSIDPQGPTSGSYRVLRGGSFHDSESGNRSAYRHAHLSFYRYDRYGFRIVRKQ